MLEHDGFIFGVDCKFAREYIVHTKAPRFVAEVFEESQAAPFEFALMTGDTLANFVWIDEPPTGNTLLALLGCVDMAFAAHDELSREGNGAEYD